MSVYCEAPINNGKPVIIIPRCLKLWQIIGKLIGLKDDYITFLRLVRFLPSILKLN